MRLRTYSLQNQFKNRLLFKGWYQRHSGKGPSLKSLSLNVIHRYMQKPANKIKRKEKRTSPGPFNLKGIERNLFFA